jgi:Adenylate kinase
VRPTHPSRGRGRIHTGRISHDPAAGHQAAELGAQLDLTLDAAVYLHVPEPVLVQRLLAWVRPDDTPEVIRHRLQVFTDTMSPLINYYRQDRGSSSRWTPTSSLSPLPPRSKLARTTCYDARSRTQWMIPPGPVNAAAVRFLTRPH